MKEPHTNARVVALSIIGLLAGCGKDFASTDAADSAGSAGLHANTGGMRSSTGGASARTSMGGSSNADEGPAGAPEGGDSSSEGSSGQEGHGGGSAQGGKGDAGSALGGLAGGGSHAGGASQSGGSDSNAATGGFAQSGESGHGGATPTGALGEACDSGSECDSNECVDGVCCESACADVCARCDAAGSEGSCTATSSDNACGELVCPPSSQCRGYVPENLEENCESIGQCVAAASCEVEDAELGTPCGTAANPGTCDGAGECVATGLAGLGEPCDSNDECASNACAPNKICCDAACDDACQVCGSEGHCDETPATDPLCIVDCPSSTTCRAYPADPGDGQCTGFGVCMTEAAYCTSAPQNEGESCGIGQICDSVGECVACPVGSGHSHTCTGECLCGTGEGVCTSDDQCEAGLVCTADAVTKLGFPPGTSSCMPSHCVNDDVDSSQGETSRDCGGECGCRASYEMVDLTDYPNATDTIYFRGMSGDGNTLIGTASNAGGSISSYPITISPSGVVTVLPNLGVTGSARAINEDGTVIVGDLSCETPDPPDCAATSTSRSYRWTNGSSPTRYPFDGLVYAVSSSGNVVTYVDDAASADRRGCRYVESSGSVLCATGLEYAVGISDDGSFAFGETPSGAAAVWDIETNTVTPIVDYPSEWESIDIDATNADGSVSVGSGRIPTMGVDYRPFILRSGTVEALTYPAVFNSVRMMGISGDGRRAVAWGFVSSTISHSALLWDEAQGLRRLYDELVARGCEFPVDVRDIGADAVFISTDGRVLVARDGTGIGSFWRIVLDE